MNKSNNKKVFKVKDDIVFKELFSAKGNEDFLIEFLSSLLKIEIRKIEIQKEAELSIQNVLDKTGAIDIKAVLNDNTIVDIEMQIDNENNIIERTVKYSSNLILSSLEKGDDYQEIKKTIIISILDFNYFKYEDYITIMEYHLKGHDEYEIPKLQTYYYIELPKFRKRKLELGNKVSEWLTFIDGENKERVEKVMGSNSLVKKAEVKFKYLTGDENERRLEELREKARFDRACMIANATERGLKRGLRQGRKEGMEKGMEKGTKSEQMRLIISMSKKKLSIQTIAEITSLSNEEIEKILNLNK